MLLAFDLDNTLITRDNRLPDRLHQAILTAHDAGHLVSVLTGRTRASALPFIDALGMVGPYSVNHGALVVGEDGETLQQTVLPNGDVQELLERYAPLSGLEYSCVVGDTLYVEDPTDPRWSWAHTLDQRIVKFEHYDGSDADKVVFSCPGDGARIHEEIRDAHPELVLYLWEDGFLEVTGENGHKGAALELIARTLGISREDTIAFGDGVNDITMVKWAGRGIAVGPFAHAEVLRAADEHIPSPEEGGVADWLEKNLFGVNA